MSSLIINIVRSGTVGDDPCVIFLTIPCHLIDTHGGVSDIEKFKFAENITAIEDQLSVMVITQSVGFHILRFRIDNSLIPTAVLQDDDTELTAPVGDGQRSVVDAHGELLVGGVAADIRTGIHGQPYLG